MSERSAVTRNVVLPASREEVWSALTRREFVTSWLGEVVEFEPVVGGSVIVREADGSTRRGLIEAVEPARALVLRWRRLAGVGSSLEVGEASRVAFTLADDGAGTRLSVTEVPVPLATSGVGT